MINLEHTEVFGWDAAIRGMRNPMNSWDKSDSDKGCTRKNWSGEVTSTCKDCEYIRGDKISPCYPDKFIIGENDLKLMKSLSKAGSDHGKFLRFINVTVDITAPLYWWKEADTYKVGTVANSCSTMHKIHAKEFELSDFSFDHLTEGTIEQVAIPLINVLNSAREGFLNYDEWNKEDPEGWDEGITCKKDIWWQMIQLLPTSYNQKRTVQLNYQVLKSMYFARRNHKLNEWSDFCDWMLTLPYFKEICVDVVENS